MATPAPLAADQIKKALAALPQWKHARGKLIKTFQFDSFKEAMSFIMRIAFEAEAFNHHPEIRNVYSTVDLALCTHDAGDAVTAADVNLAKAIEHVNWLAK